MNPQISSVVLGVKDVKQSRQFYAEGLGCPVTVDTPGFIQFNLGEGAAELAIYPWKALAQDAGVPAENNGGFRGFTLNYIVATTQRVDEVMGDAEKAGAKVIKPAAKQQWGGYSGTFEDLDGYVWKVASNAQ